jgi:hypothetical protein
MLVYERFTGDMDWNPRIVDELYLDEEFWLPRIKEARSAAMKALSAVEDMQQ